MIYLFELEKGGSAMKIIEENTNYSTMWELGKSVESSSNCPNNCYSDDGDCPNFCDIEWGS